MKSKYLFFVLFFIIYGCGTVNSIVAGGDMVNLTSSNEVTKEQAAKIAKEYCQSNPKDCKNCWLSSLKVSENEKWFPGQWLASFRSKQLSTLDHRFFIFIDKKTGKVVKTEWTK